MKFPLYSHCPFCKRKLVKSYVPNNVNSLLWEKYSCNNVKERYVDESGFVKYKNKANDHCESFEDFGTVDIDKKIITWRQIEFIIKPYVITYYVDDKVTVISNSISKPQKSIELPYFLDIDFYDLSKTINKIKLFFLFS